MSHTLPDEVVCLVLSQYTALNFKPPPRQFTILAAFVLTNGADARKVIALATGSKCLPAVKLQPGGDIVHDSHAEVLARRGAVRFCLEEIGRVAETGVQSAWIERNQGGKFRLGNGVRLHLYVSTLPCGDASTRYLAVYQDEAMATLKESAVLPELAAGVAARGRDNYSLYGVLRTKPGRADSLPTSSMSCSDKIASWNVLGIQGAQASRFLEPLYIDSIILGEVEPVMRADVQEDCERALWKRLAGVDAGRLPNGYYLHQPTIDFTGLPFNHSKMSLAQSRQAATSCNDSLCWIADSPRAPEVLINGLRRGVPPKHRANPKFRPLLSKIVLFELSERTACLLGMPSTEDMTYSDAKASVTDYQNAKNVLRGQDGPFAGWVRTGGQWEAFKSSHKIRSSDIS